MASTVNLPVFGPTNKGTVIGVVIAGSAVSAYMIYRHQKKASEAAAAVTATQQAEGYGYGYGYGTAQGAYGYGGVTYGYGASGGFPPTGYYGYGVVQPPGQTVPGIPATTNAQWVQAAVTQLSSGGFAPQRVLKVLGEYIAGHEVAPGDVAVVDAAIGVEGYPPTSGANGFPPGIKTGGTTGGGQSSKVEVPHVKGLTGVRAHQLLSEAGLQDHQIPAHIGESHNSTVTSQSPTAGRRVNPGSTVTVRLKVSK
jgi:hypothetical protein